MLLAVGPQLISIQPNSGDVLSNGVVRNVAPQQLTFVFDESQQIDADTLGGIRLTRAGFDNTFDGVTDVLVTPGYVEVNPDRPNEVVYRFAETIPDDLYRIEVFAIDDSARGIEALRNVEGDPFEPSIRGADRTTVTFELDLGAQVLAVVPQPVARLGDGSLVQARNAIEVYFNNDNLRPSSATNPQFYSLIHTNGTVSNTDDTVMHPSSVSYDAATDKAVLLFDTDLDSLGTGTGTYRLRIGSDEALPIPPERTMVDGDPGSSFDTAFSLGSLDASLLLSGMIDPQDVPLQFPGSVTAPGHRDIAEVETHLNADADSEAGIQVFSYNFKTNYGWAPNGRPLINLITEEQKQRTREIFELYGYYLGVKFVETPEEGLTIVTGDMRAVDPTVDIAPGGVIGIAGDANPDPDITWPTAVMDNSELWDDKFGESLDPGRLSWFDTAMHEIGHLIGLGHTYDLPPYTVMGQNPELTFNSVPEPIFPGDHDIVHGQHLYRPEGNDIDVYQFELDEPGEFTAEIIAERLPNASLLDGMLSLYEVTDNGPRLVARNDDYFSEDAYLDLSLPAGSYYLAVTSTGNVEFDPTIEGTGANGTTDGAYDLRLDFRPRVDNFLVDATGTLLDGDANGVPGGEFNFWFQIEDEARTLFVDKSAPAGGDGSLARPYNNLGTATSAAQQRLVDGGLIRVIGNGGADGLVSTRGDNLAYEIGSSDGRTLSDGLELRLPKDVVMMVDAGAIFKMLRSNIQVGSSSVTIDRSGSALQILGVPQTPVVFTSYDDQTIGVDTNPRQTTPDPGDWGGLIFHNQVDRAEGRFDFEQEGIFLNVVNQADIRYGGGNVRIDSIQQVINPIHMVDARPTVSYNRISFSADAALSADPDSFEETNFTAPDSLGVDYQATPFTADYRRIGPDLRSNTLLNNSINGIFVRIATPAGGQLERLTVAGRFDDTDIVHVMTENLIIASTPGGPFYDPAQGIHTARLDAQLKIDPGVIVKLDGARIETQIGAQFLAEGVTGREVVLTSLQDNRFGAAGTFRTNTPSDGVIDPPRPGDWSGIYLAPAARGSIDHALIAFAGGLSRVEGSFAGFNAIEAYQADLRLTNSVLTDAANGRGGQSEPTREGRGRNEQAGVFVRGAQPIIVNNVFKDIAGILGGAININVNALNYELISDPGRSTGMIERFDEFTANHGPLIRLNRLGNNDLNGMVVRGGTLTTEGVWDDTDIVHVLYDEVVVPNLHTFGGLRLESSPTESLVVKFGGPFAGIKASGNPLDIDDRIGGMLHILGQPGQPVVMTALSDDTVGAGFDPSGAPQTDTDGYRREPGVQLPGSFQIQLNYGPLLKAQPEYVTAMELAARFWERWVEDPITVSLDLEIDPALQGSGVLGAASAEFVSLDWDEVRQALIDDARAHEVDLVTQMPIFDDTNFLVPNDPANPFSINRTLTVTRANALAMGFDPADIPAPTSAYDPSRVRDASIVFAPNPWEIAADGTPGFFDLDRLDGITPGFTDLVGVAVHEIGHALGFVSGVDDVDLALNDPNSFRDINLRPLDMFRLRPGAGSRGFADAPRVADPALLQVFYDGGIFDPDGIPIPGLRLGDIPLSQGSDNGDGGQASHWKDGIGLGLMDPTISLGEAWFTDADRSAFDLIGWDVPGEPSPGDWRGVTLETYSHDRNVGVVTELEDPKLPAPGDNALPATAQVLGGLGQGEKDSDENLRLGFIIHGTLDEPNDIDVYSFEASAGTEVWFDIDRTAPRLDSVVELVDANGVVLARSDNSFAEAEGTEQRFAVNGIFHSGLQKSLFYDQDHGTTNLLDAGMRLILPGAAGAAGTYHVRVRSSSENLDNLSGGLTSGSYQLQIRLDEVDEYAGSTIQFADVRYAMDGIRVRGLPKHSPLTGEVAEMEFENAFGQLVDRNTGVALGTTLTEVVSLDANSRVLVRPTVGPVSAEAPIALRGQASFEDAQYIGNVLQSDRAAISLAGRMDDGFRLGEFTTDVADWYLFEVRFGSIQQPGGNFAELAFDLDYADGMARPDFTMAIYSTEFIGTGQGYVETSPGSLLYYSEQGGGPDDRPAPLQGSDLDDLSRGSLGTGDPGFGPVSLAEGFYLLQITSPAVTQLERLQYTEELAPNPYIRFEPVDSMYRIAEDRINEPITEDGQGTTFSPPQVPLLLDPRGAAVPFTLGDVELFVSSNNSIFSVDPFTGTREVAFGALTGMDGTAGIAPLIGDFALRDNPLFDPASDDPNAARSQRLMAFAQDLGLGEVPNDGNVGGYIWLDITEETSAERGSSTLTGGVAAKGVGENGTLTDDGVLTWGPDPDSEDPAAPDIIAINEGLFYDAIAFNPNAPDQREGYAIGRRPSGLSNVLVRFDAVTGQVFSATGEEQPDEERIPVPNPTPVPPPPVLPPRVPNAGLNIVEQGVLNTEIGGGPGGDITGLAFRGSTLYGVSNRGGLYQINGYAGEGASVRYLATVFQPSDDPEAEPVPIRFTGLTLGPQDVENRAYSDLLFGIDNRGTLYAFNTSGELQPIFANGELSVRTGVSGATGLDFGTLDENLWHVTQTRGGDPGHGRLFPAPQGGGASFYFGEDVNRGGGDPRFYDFLGGARGSIQSEEFSLDGFSEIHEPYIYFTYFLTTEQSFTDPLNPTPRDTFRVFLADDTREDGRGQWHLLASNQPGEWGTALDVNPDDDILVDVQPLWDNTFQDVPFQTGGRNGNRDPFPYPDDDALRPFDPGDTPWGTFDPPLNETEGVWRQARISLADFAGSDSLRLRFDFSTAGSFDLGRTGGVELRAIPGSRLVDGDAIEVGGESFEFDLGYTLIALSGKSIADGDTIAITDDAATTIVLEMDSNGTTSGANIPVNFTANDPANVVAEAIQAAIENAGFSNVTVHANANRLNLEGVVNLQVTSADGLLVEGAPGTEGTPILVNAGMSAEDVAAAMVQPLADVLAGGVTSAIKSYRETVRIIGNRVNDPGPLGMTSALPGDATGNFGNPLRAKNTPENNGRNDERFYSFGDEELDFSVPFEGVYVDDLVIGFAAYGEQGADLRPAYPHEPALPPIPNVFEPENGGLAQLIPPPGTILVGEYQVEIRRASDYADGVIPNRTFDPRDRLSKGVSLEVPSGGDLNDGFTIFVSDGVRTLTFEFDDQRVGDGVQTGRIAVPFLPTDSASTMVERLRDAINAQFLAGRLAVSAASSNGAAIGFAGTTNRLDLFGEVVNAGGDLEPTVFNETGVSNRFRDQGQIVIASNTISHSALFGVVVEDAPRDFPCLTDGAGPFCDFPHYDVADLEDHAQGNAADYNPSFGAPRNLRELNQEGLAPSVVIANNVIAFSGEGGIHFSGDPSGHIVIAPVGGPTGLAEVWDDGDVHFLLAIIDNNGDSEVFEFRAGAQPPLGLTDQVITWNTTADCPQIHPLAECAPRYSAANPDMAESILTAIGNSTLDIQPIRTRGDELYLEGARTILSAVVRGDATSVSFTGDSWFYPFNILPPRSAVPFGRIVNNTVVGLGGTLEGNNLYNADDFRDVGILIEDYANPTLLNNVVVNFEVGLKADMTSLDSIVGGMLFQGNRDNAENVDVGDFVIELGNDEPLFVDWEAGNFYPADLARVIDSSVDSLEDRTELVTVKEPVGISLSPILAPDFDVLGQLRIDDPRVEPPEGFGRNVFKDRGAIDRVDFLGPIVRFQTPRDNDVTGLDRNPAEDQVRLEDSRLTRFVVQLEDLGEATAPTGTGIADSTVTSDSVILRRDGEVLQPGVDYRFDYQSTTNQIVLTPQAGVWLSGFTYEIELLNRDRHVVTLGNFVADGEVVRVTDPNGSTRAFEFESGMSMRVPQTLTLIVPAGSSGLSAVADREIFTISNGVRLVTFEFDSNNTVTSGRIRVPFQPSSTPNQVADAIINAINSADLGLDPVNLGGGRVHIGGPFSTLLDTTVSSLEQEGQPGVFVDGQTIRLRNGNATVRFEFDSDGVVAGTNTAISFDPNATRRELAMTVLDTINASSLGLNAILGPEGLINFGAVAGLQVDLETSNLATEGATGTRTPGATVVSFRPSETMTAASYAELLQTAIHASSLTDLTTLINEAGQLAILDAEQVTSGLEVSFIAGIRDIAGNLLRTNQDTEPFGVLLTVDLPAPLDFGDAPDPSYPTLLNSNGARHVVVPNIQLGATNSAELDGAPSGGDASDDGVVFLNVAAVGGRIPVRITASTEGFIDAWIDMDGDGSFNGLRDRIMSSQPVVRGQNDLIVEIPDDAQLGNTWSRFRFSTSGGLNATGRANDGEVEDHPVELVFVESPIAANDAYQVNEDELLTVDLASSVLQNDQNPVAGSLTAVLVEPPANGAVELNADGSFTYTPNQDFFGTDTFTYEARTEILGSNMATVTIEVLSQPDPPVAGDDNVSTPEDTPVMIDLVVNDVDPDGALVRSSIVVTVAPSNGSLSVDENGQALYTPNRDFFGVDSFQYTIEDAEGAVSAPATVTIRVQSVNDPPIANADQLFVRQGIPVTFDLLANDTDVDGTLNRQSVVITSTPKSGTVRFTTTGEIVFTPDPTFLGVDTFRYTVRDNQGATSNVGVVTVTVSGQNFAPTAQNDTATTSRGQAVSIDVLANDSDPDGELVNGSVVVTVAPANGTVTVNVNGTVDYVPNAGFVGTDQFRYTVRDDANALSNAATVVVTVQDVGPPWQNPANRLDVNNDTFVSPIDALLVINEINARGSRPLDPPPSPVGPIQPPPFLDANGDSFLSPLDALLIINHLNAPNGAEGEFVPSSTDIGAALHIQPRAATPRASAGVVDQVIATPLTTIATVEPLMASGSEDAWESHPWNDKQDRDADDVDEAILDLLTEGLLG